MTPVPRTPQQLPLPATRTFLLVEGDDEVRVVSAVDPQRPDRVVHDARGQGNLLKETDTLLLAPEFGRSDNFGLVLDAEEDPTSATALTREVLRRLGCPVDTQHAQVYSSAGKRWGFFLLPDGTSKGALESLLRLAFDPNAQSATCAGCARSTCSSSTTSRYSR